MDDKNKARLMRELADKMFETANVCSALEWQGFAAHYRNTAENFRQEADRLDPPVVWEKGDLVRDHHNRLWEYDGTLWYSRGFGGYDTKLLTGENGPIRKVYVSDPSEKQIVVSVKNFDLSWWEHLEENVYDTDAEGFLKRTAQAVREQLGEAAPGGDGA